MRPPRGIAQLVVALALVLAGAPTYAQAPPERETMRAVFPAAESFGAFEGEPPVAPAYREGERVGYVFRTRQVVASEGFSGKPLDILVGLDLEGRLTGARILEHNEPILQIGVAEEDLEAFVARYVGLDAREPIRITRRPSDEPRTVDAVAGATVSSAVINDAILQAARAVARSKGIFGEPRWRLDVDRFRPASWRALREEGSLVRLELSVGTVAEALARRNARLYPEGAGPDDASATFIDLYVGLATPAAVGRNLLGKRRHSELMADLAAGDQLLFAAGRGLYSFRGTHYLRTGVFDRVQLVQGARTIQLRKDDHVRIDELAVDDAPALREIAIFKLPQERGFDPLAPWRLELLVGGERLAAPGQVFVSFALPYTLPEAYIVERAEAGEAREKLWVQRWQDRRLDVAILALALAVLTLLLVFQDYIARRGRVYEAVRVGFLAFTLLWLGWYAGAQLSVLNVLTFAEALRTRFRWDFFLLEPLLFILWSYVAVALLFWGRGVFCGWLCPFGALQELLNRMAQALRVPQLKVPFALHERLWPIKYVVFLSLFALSLGSMTLANAWAEVEPFKTAIVLKFAREWQYVLYALALLAIGVFVERPFCRYLCPLGGALAIPARLRMFEWLKRRPQCGTQCHICAVSCPVEAIHRTGHINPNECIYCLKCQKIMYDDHVCPPLVERRKRREARRARRAAVAEHARGPS